MISAPKISFAFILLSYGKFGGAENRFINLYFFLSRTYTQFDLYFFVTKNMYEQLTIKHSDKDLSNFIIVDANSNNSNNNGQTNYTIKEYNPVPRFKLDFLRKSSLYKTFYFIRSYQRYYNQFKIINKVVKDKSIKSILSIYTGVFPLYFYFSRKNRPSIIFSNMDSWFSHLSSNVKKDWYRKYDLFNYAHEKSDIIDILSPFILKGLKERNIKISDNKISMTECSFVDYSICKIDSKLPFSFAFSARLERDKNPIIFINAVSVLSKIYTNVNFHIIGSGRLHEEIKKRVINLGLSNVIFHGYLNNPVEVLKNTSVFISLQSTNNYPSQSILEAMACGNAIIATDVGDTRMFINENNGTLIELSEQSLINAMKYYINNQNIAQTQGINASEYIRKEFTIERSAEYYIKLFQKSLNLKS